MAETQATPEATTEATPGATTEALKPAPAPHTQPVAHTKTVPDVPDPDEEDLDDLDDLLDQFSANSISGSGPGRPTAVASSSAPALPISKEASKETKSAKPPLEADFSAELQKEMAALLGEIDQSPEMRRQLDMLMGELSSSAEKVVREQDGQKDHAESSKGIPGAATEAAFTDTIKKTMDRMAASGQQASAAATTGSGEEDMLASLLKDLAAGGGEGPESEEFSKMLMNMMEQLTNKDVLYEPMKELHDKFPDWIKDNEGKVPAEDMTRYKEQRALVNEIVGRFERPGYKDENPEDREYIVERMQKMQAAGNPPADLVGNMQDTHNALGDIGNDCAQQ